MWYTPFVRAIRSDTETGWWEMVTRQPARQLRGGVRRYTGYRENSYVPYQRREIPTGDVALIMSFGPRIRVLGLGLGLGECGSFDRSHLNRDFNLITGIVPARFTGTRKEALAFRPGRS